MIERRRRPSTRALWPPAWLATILLLLLGSCQASRGAETTVTFPSADGWQLHGTRSLGPQSAPGVLLVHMCNVGDQDDYRDLAQQLRRRGLHSLRFDFRGHGLGRTPALDVTRDRDGFWQNIVGELQQDVDAAYARLASEALVWTEPVAIVAASCGVRRAVDLARRQPAIRALVLLSGEVPSELWPVLAAEGRQVFAVAAADDGDGVAAQWAREACEAAGGRGQLRIYPSGGHGTELFASHGELPTEILDWLGRVLVTDAEGE
ncbi:MAG: alpha/beta hydrolase [Planctomycetota bacterium]